MSDNWERAYRQLTRRYEEKCAEYDKLERKSWELESQVRELMPYKKAAERQYDRWALDVERQIGADDE